MPTTGLPKKISAVDLFCGVGGLSYGLMEAGIKVAAGIDVDAACRYPYETNIDGATFVKKDIRKVTAKYLKSLWVPGSVKLLVGCAPCQPFSPYQGGVDTSADERWSLLNEVGRLVRGTRPELVSIENVPRIRNTQVFKDFTDLLTDLGYSFDARTCACVEHGLPQTRRRLVLVASRIGEIELPQGEKDLSLARTVRDVIGDLPSLRAGEADPDDPLHRARNLSETNLKRIRHSVAGGTWQDWPAELRSPCHQRKTGSTFRNVYARMEWDKPAPTITTLFHNFGTGRFGHPEQDRPISIREASLLQGFPPDYAFVESDDEITFTNLGRLIGNAVPPPVGSAVGETFKKHVREN